MMAHKRLGPLSHKGLNLGAPNLLTICLLEEKLKDLLFQAQPPHTCLSTWELGLWWRLASCLSCPAGREMPHASTLEVRQGGAYSCAGPSVKATYAALAVLTAVNI